VILRFDIVYKIRGKNRKNQQKIQKISHRELINSSLAKEREPRIRKDNIRIHLTSRDRNTV
jgi:hypothetical protein